MNERPALIEARGLRAGYDAAAVVNGVSLRVMAGEVVALLGPNGAGKTTTILTLAGNHPASAGEVRLDGKATREPLHRRARWGLALVPEERSTITRLSVADNLRVARADQSHALDLFPELAGLLTRRAGLLSGGEQQILALARALARRPRLLLADELSFGLAPLIVRRLLGALRHAADEGLGVLVVEQHAQQVLAVADRVYVMQRGRIVHEADGAELRDDPTALRRLYLGGRESHERDHRPQAYPARLE